ncbi:NXPE family member 3-like [Mercenaria mercenaria]|uniref:NXPE family member 3-like n=1 Tax=Mercenaria mercenaria TaxID=6596 RepID=UPI00234E4B1F|nr:NXPE family member 3-like [Mercenaria mercenaria]
MTSVKFSRLKTIKYDNEGNIVVAIETYDMKNNSKTVGDDVIVVWASQSDGDGLVSGHVIDHKNGSYTGTVKVFWTGFTKVNVKLASSLENTCLRLKALKKYGNTVFAMQKAWGIRGTFRTNLIREDTVCGTNQKIFGFKDVCNFTSLNGGMSWFCGKPKHTKLPCSSIDSFGTGRIDTSMVGQSERIQNNGHGIFNQNLLLDIQNYRTGKRNCSCSLRPPLLSWKESEPSGFWLDSHWNFVKCYSSIKHDIAPYRQCLKNKNVVIIGDSTLRQYAAYFIRYILGLGPVDMKGSKGPNGQYHGYKLFKGSGINLMYIKHEMPLHNPNLPAKDISSVPQILRTMEDNDLEDNSLILIINYNSHFSAHPPSKFRERIRYLAIAIESFLSRKPRTKILFKGPHLCINDARWFDPRISLLYKQIVREEFSKLMNNVIYLDVWSISVAHNHEQLHPYGDAFFSQINQLMAYIC